VTVTGNELTQQKVILHELELRPGRPLDLQYLEQSARNLQQRNLFSPGSIRITPQAPSPDDPEHRDVNVEVQETNTGAISIGATVSSDANVVGRFAITQRNFDLFDPPDSFGEFITGRAFRGAGQTFNIEILPGTQVQTYAVSLSDPTLLDTDYSGSITAFLRNRVYRQFDEERYGAQASIGRNFGRVWSGAITFRNEWIDLSDIDDDAPVDVFEVQDQNRLGVIGLSLDRTTVDSRTRPSRGSRLGFSLEQAGLLGGDFDFTRFRADYTTFATIYESFLGYRTILKLNSQMGYIPQGQDATPVYERFYLGGQSFRGFAFRGISPRGIRQDTLERGDDPVGGTFMFFAGAEVQQPVYQDTLSVVAFLDTGTVATDFGFDQYRASVGFGGRLFIPALSPIPLAFDFGFPIFKQTGDRERVFTFSIDLPFQ
jgi:outer membrane protein insertion porin family